MNTTLSRQRPRVVQATITWMAALLLLGTMAGNAFAAPGDTTRVSLNGSGNQADNGSLRPSASADGRYVAFESSASNLVAGDTNGADDILVRDRQTGATERASLGGSGSQANGASSQSSISDDGRFVAFESDASNLVPDDTNGINDVFVRDRQTGATERVSVSGSGGQGDSHSRASSMSADGRYVAFSSSASNLVEGDTNNRTDVFVHDRQTGVTIRISVSSSGTEATGGYGGSYYPSISDDGRHVAFVSSNTNLVGDDTNNRDDIFVHDRQTDSTTRVSVGNNSNQAIGHSYVPSMSADGRFVAFWSNSNNLIGSATEGFDTFLRDRDLDADGVFDEQQEPGATSTELASVDNTGNEAFDGGFPFGINADVFRPSISDDGRYVSFVSGANLAEEGDFNDFYDVYVRDRHRLVTDRVSEGSNGFDDANGVSSRPSISADGRFVAFESGANNLIEGDTNGVYDAFVREQDTAQPNDSIAPTTAASGTTASGATYTSGTWTNEDVKVTFSARDNEGGSGVKEIRYSAAGAQSIAETVYDSQNPPLINTEGTTTMSYFAIDNAGNRESPQKTVSVKIDKGAPTVAGVSPARAATDVPLTINPEVTFSEAMNGISVANSTNFTLTKQGSSSPVAASSVGYSDATKKATLDPASDLEAGTTYTATVKGGSSGVKDLAGNALTQDYAWSFIAAPPPVPKCTMTGTANAETISGTSGADVICAGGGNDTIKGLGGNDTLKGEAGNDTLLGGVGNDTLDGGLGTDTASYSASLTAVVASLATNTATGEGSDTFVGAENLLGSSMADTLTGSSANNRLTGGGGNDNEHGGLGNDTVIGSGGADTLKGEGGNDVVNSSDGVNGNDALDGGAGTDTKVTDSTEKSVVGFP